MKLTSKYTNAASRLGQCPARRKSRKFTSDSSEPKTQNLCEEAGSSRRAELRAHDDGRVVRIGYAGGRSLFGLRGELGAALSAGEAPRFRVEVTAQYLSRYEELLMVHKADFGDLPPGNASEARRRIGRLSPG